MNTKGYLGAVKDKTAGRSVYAAAALLGIKEDTVRAWHLGRSHPDAYACSKIAECLNLDPLKVLADVQIEAEKDEVKRAHWKKLARKLSAWAPVFLAIAIGTTPDYSQATQLSSFTGPSEETRYKLCDIGRALRRLSAFLLRGFGLASPRRIVAA